MWYEADTPRTLPPPRKPRKKPRLPCPSESSEQQALFSWADSFSGRYPALSLLYHIPNEGKRTKATGGRLKAEGLRSGVPDVCLPVPNETYSGLYIEMKSKTGRATEEQLRWLELLKSHGHKTAVCYSFEDAAQTIMSYLHIEGSPYHVNLR